MDIITNEEKKNQNTRDFLKKKIIIILGFGALALFFSIFGNFKIENFFLNLNLSETIIDFLLLSFHFFTRIMFYCFYFLFCIEIYKILIFWFDVRKDGGNDVKSIILLIVIIFVFFLGIRIIPAFFNAIILK